MNVASVTDEVCNELFFQLEEVSKKQGYAEIEKFSRKLTLSVIAKAGFGIDLKLFRSDTEKEEMSFDQILEGKKSFEA